MVGSEREGLAKLKQNPIASGKSPMKWEAVLIISERTSGSVSSDNGSRDESTSRPLTRASTKARTASRRRFRFVSESNGFRTLESTMRKPSKAQRAGMRLPAGADES